MNDRTKTREELVEELEATRARLELAEEALARRAAGDAAEPERQRIERELRKQEEQLRLIVEGVRDHAISMLDPDGRIVTFNRAAQQIKGHALEEVRGHYFGLFFTPEDRAAGLPELELETARKQGRYEGEGWRERKDGSRFYASVSLSRLQDESGALIGFVKVTQDRTRYRELTEALHQRESELRLIVDAIPGLIAYMSPDETYRHVNRAYEDWFGSAPAQFVGKRLSDVLGPQAYETIRPHVDAALAGQRVSFQAEVPYAGGARWVRGTYIPDFDANGAVLGYVSLVLDITETKLAEKRLTEEARLNETLYRVGTALAQDLDLETVFARLTDEATALCRAQFGAFFYNVNDPERGRYMLYT
ncbi:MAG: PAS domain S-box protein, partial [Myxococcota bacterium]|nr:PAS domain S-box protein [Myxococcota bacterium]